MALSPSGRLTIPRLTALRLAAQRISSSRLTTAADVVRWMLAMQAQDLGGARWSVGLRLPGSTEETVEAALASGEIVRSWPMRGTLHLTTPEDLGWMLDIAVVRQATTAAKRRADLGISAAELSRAGELATGLMVGGRAVRRDVVLEEWDRAGIPTAGQRGYQLLWSLAHLKVVVLGPPDGRHPTFALFDEWVAAPRALSGDEALGEFAGRYFHSHGPATVRDFAWWASLTLGAARTGLAIAEPGLEEHRIDGVGYFSAPGLEPDRSRVHALPGFDEYLLGYQDRSAVLEPEFAGRIVPGNNGIFLPTVIAGGRVIGTWKRVDAARSTRIDLSPFRTLPNSTRVGFRSAIARYSTFTGRPATVAE